MEQLPWGAALAPQTVEKPKSLSVSEFTQELRNTLEPRFQTVWIHGEVGNYRPATSGHWYFSLKDAGAMLSAVCFRAGSRQYRFQLKDGMQVLCRGRVSIYPPRGGYQLVVDQIEPLGAGALQIAFDQLKTKLQAEGLFDASRKKAIPPRPSQIAVVTSATGAALQDVLTILKRRAPVVKVLLVPALVQGELAAPTLIEALRLADQSEAQLILLTRGGGSQEDLWCFNDERLIRAIAELRLPVISAVGHEIDVTLSDWVADLRAPTPSAAAEMISNDWIRLQRDLHSLESVLLKHIRDQLRLRFLEFSAIQGRLRSPINRIQEQRQRLDELTFRIRPAIENRIRNTQLNFSRVIAQMEALSPLKVLSRGYALVHAQGRPDVALQRASDLKVGMRVSLRFHDGSREVEVCS